MTVRVSLLLVMMMMGWWPVLGADPQRIVSTAPSITESVFALGAGDRLVGVTSYCRYPPEAQRKTVVGDFASPNLESVLRLHPDLVVVLSDRNDLIERFTGFGLPVLVLRQETLNEVLESFLVLGERVGCRQAAQELVGQLRGRLDAIRRRLEGRRRPRTLFLVGRNTGSLSDLYAAGESSYLGELLELAGAENSARGAAGAYPKLSLEEILRRDPEVILDLSHGSAGSDPQAEREIRELWARFPGLTAVRQRRVHVLVEDVFLIPGPRLVDAVEKLVKLIHGDSR
jgi:iron complex transport system substrate-binding protein